MGIGDTLKADIDGLRELLGSACTLNGTTPLGKCSLRELVAAEARNFLGDEYSDELDLPWILIEAPAASQIKEGDKITVDITEQDWIVRRVMRPTAGDVILSKRCVCVGKVL